MATVLTRPASSGDSKEPEGKSPHKPEPSGDGKAGQTSGDAPPSVRYGEG
jgi:hypothetical protein